MPFCGNCGSQHKDGLKFCTNCGKPIEQDNDPTQTESQHQFQNYKNYVNLISLQSFSDFLITILYIGIGISVLEILYAFFSWEKYILYSSGENFGAIGYIVGLFFIVFYIIRYFWIYKASKIYNEVYDNMEYSPAMSVAWFLIPVVNLFMPYFVMKDLCKNTETSCVWWYVFYLLECFFLTFIIFNSGVNLNAVAKASVFFTLASIFSCFYFIKIVLRVCRKGPKSNIVT